MGTTSDATPAVGGLATRQVRRDAGRSRRRDLPLENLADVAPTKGRPDPIAILCAQDAGRVPDLVPIRHGRMGATAFTFYRGAAAIMASDLSRTGSTDLKAQLCGDAHLSNFGIFNGANHQLVFDVNDFDETLPGPFEWDLKRLTASVTIAARSIGLSPEKAARATRAAVAGYRGVMDDAAATAPLDLRYVRLNVDSLADELSGKHRKTLDKQTRKAQGKNSLKAQRKLTDVVDGRRRIVADPPLITRLDAHDRGDNLNEMRDFFGDYLDTLPLNRRRILSRYSLVDLAHKVVGVGSVGTRCLIVFLESGDDEPLFLQFKEATQSVLEPYLGASEFDQAGERVVQGQRLMQATGDIFLGWARFEGGTGGSSFDFYFRQMWDGKGSADVDAMGSKRLRHYARNCGGALALAHARSGDAAMISGYLGDDETADHALATFSAAYADINESDHAAHEAAVADGKIAVVKDL